MANKNSNISFSLIWLFYQVHRSHYSALLNLFNSILIIADRTNAGTICIVNTVQLYPFYIFNHLKYGRLYCVNWLCTFRLPCAFSACGHISNVWYIWEFFLWILGALFIDLNPDSKVHGANRWPTWAMPAIDGPHAGPMNLAIREYMYIEVYEHKIQPRHGIDSNHLYKLLRINTTPMK